MSFTSREIANDIIGKVAKVRAGNKNRPMYVNREIAKIEAEIFVIEANLKTRIEKGVRKGRSILVKREA